MSPRIGNGYDLHRLVPDRRLMLGGVTIPYDRGLLGHSDADVVLHAVCDALLGALAQPDIGELFPDDDPRWQGADSRVFLEEAVRRVADQGYVVGNVDLTVLAQQPRLKPFKQAIRERLAELLAVSVDRVGLKATTNEGLDAIGRGEAIACWATVLLEHRG